MLSAPRTSLDNVETRTIVASDDIEVVEPRRPAVAFERTWTEQSRKGSTLYDASAPGSRSQSTMKRSVIYVEFTENDPRNPLNFSRKKKWIITSIACCTALLCAIATTAFSMGFPSMIQELDTNEMQATIGLSLYSISFAIVPLISAPLSEEIGRQPLYLGSFVAFLFLCIPHAYGNDIRVVQIARFLQGAVASTGSIMVGGTIADIWAPEERNLPMSVFSLMIVGGHGLGPTIGGWVEFSEALQWRWIGWIQMIVCAVCLVLLPFMQETRGSVILNRIASQKRKESGDSRYRTLEEVEHVGLAQRIWISCTRPLRILLTEPIVASVSLWIGFAWGVLFCFVDSIEAVFNLLHQFHPGEVGTAFSAMVVGTLIGFVWNIKVQQRLYRNHFAKRGVEARLISACGAGVIFPIAMFVYAASCTPGVHWIGLVLGILSFSIGVFLIYVSVFTYLADCYGAYASSALAGQSLFRILLGAIFPLFTSRMFKALTYRWANMMFAGFALLLMPIPFVLFFYGPALRQRSEFSRQLTAEAPPTIVEPKPERDSEKQADA
ncbi:drug transporter [Coprinopsis sp. MPI-PUGE-AT-0042]|nr:drug transporter [Coprinopsis sp. MPI-PUGE-AT-0042]